MLWRIDRHLYKLGMHMKSSLFELTDLGILNYLILFCVTDILWIGVFFLDYN